MSEMSVDGKRSRARKRYRPPGVILPVVAALAIMVLFCLHYGWWPSRFGTSSWAEPLLFFLGALLVLVVVGLIWAVCTLIYAVEERQWSWWILPVPAVVVVAVAVGNLVPPMAFEDVRPEFEDAAQELLPGPDQTRENLEIGRFDIDEAFKGSDGTVYFREESWFGFGSSSGWVYSPNGQPVGFGDFSSTLIDGPWYEYTEVYTG